jgi:hypothetical protein
MQTDDTISGTVRAVTALGRDARRVAAALQRHQFGIADPHKLAIYHRLALVAMEPGQAIDHAEAALSPSARIAIAELASS